MFDGEVDEDIDLVENVLVNYVEKTATLKGEDGEIKLGNVYDEEGNVETSYSIAIDEAPPSGFITIKKQDLLKLIRIVDSHL